MYDLTSYRNNLQKFGILYFWKRGNNFIIGGFVASQPRPPLIFYFLLFQAFEIIKVRTVQLTDFLRVINNNNNNNNNNNKF